MALEALPRGPTKALGGTPQAPCYPVAPPWAPHAPHSWRSLPYAWPRAMFIPGLRIQRPQGARGPAERYQPLMEGISSTRLENA